MKALQQIAILCIAILSGLTLYGQDPSLARARYLKSIYKTDEAIEILSSLVSDEFNEEVLSELADCHFQNGDYDSASATYMLLSARVPENISYKIKQMQSSYRLRDYPGSIDAGKQILQIDSIPAVASFIGDAYQHLNQPDSALCYYRQSLAWKPFNAAVVAKASNILIAKRDYDGALLQTQTYLESDPDNPVVAPIQGLAYYRKDDYDNAILVLQRQEDLGNDIYPVHFYLGQSYWQTEVIYRAEQELLAAWQIDSSDVNLAYSIAVVKSDAFRSFDKEVKPWLDKVRDMLEPDPIMMSRLHHQYATGYYKLQESWDKAIEHYKESYRYNPKHISALSSIAYCYELKKDYKHALEWYEKYLKVATPGTKGYEFAAKSIDWLKAERFMEEK